MIVFGWMGAQLNRDVRLAWEELAFAAYEIPRSPGTQVNGLGSAVTGQGKRPVEAGKDTIFAADDPNDCASDRARLISHQAADGYIGLHR